METHLAAVAEAQEHVLSRRQLYDVGITRGRPRAHLAAGRASLRSWA